MASDKELNIGIKVTSDTAGAKQATTSIGGVTDAIQEQTAATNQLAAATARATEQAQQFISANAYGKFDDTLLKAHDAMKKATVSANGVAQATKEVGKANSQGAMGFMALSNAVQDVQYGFGGIINNIPGIVSGMGLGMGVAGAAQIAGVAFGVLNKNVDLFGTEAAAAAKEATTTANEATALANSTQRAADAAADAAKKYAELNAALKKTEADYKAVSTASDEAIESAKRLQDIDTKRGDLQSELAMAEIDAMAAGGQISKEDAAARREGVRAQRAARAAALEEKAMEAAAKAEQERAAAAEGAAKAQKNILDGKLKEENAMGLLTAKQRDEAQKALDAFEREAEAAKARAEDEEKTHDWKSAANDAAFAVMGDTYTGSADEKAALARIESNKAQEIEQRNRAQAARQKLIEDAAARGRTGFKGAEDFQAQREGALTKLGEYETAADRARRQAGIIGGNLGLARETTAVRARIAAITQTSAAAAAAQSGYGIGFMGPVPPQGFAVDQKEAERAAKEAERENKKSEASQYKSQGDLGDVAFAGAKLAASLSDQGVGSGFTDRLRKASSKAGESDALARLIAMVSQLTATSAKLSEASKAKLDKLEAEIADLRTAK